MRTCLPDAVTRVEETAFGDVADLIVEAQGGEGPERTAQVQLILGRWSTASLLRELAGDRVSEECRHLAADEIYLRVLSDANPPVAIALGGSPQAACHAAYAFLEKVLRFGFFLVGNRIPDLNLWRPEPVLIRMRPALSRRLFLSHPFFAAPWRYCCRLWGEDQWRHTIDWLRRKRYTHLVSYHDEGGYLWGRIFGDTFPEARTRDNAGFVMEPDRRTELNRQVFRYAQDSGLSIAYRFMYSVLPQSFAQAHPELVLHPQPTNSVSVCPGEPECASIMEQFWTAILETHPPTDDQLYLVSTYGHRQLTCEHVRDRTVPALDAVRVIRRLDPDARVFVDAPNSPDPEANAREWESLQRVLPADVGIVDWDSGLRAVEDWGGLAGGQRAWMPVVHLSRTGYYPPVCATIKEEQLHALWLEASEGGASGVIAFNVLANTSSTLTDYAAELGFDPTLQPDTHRLDYACRRYGPQAADGMSRAYRRFLAGLVPELSLPLSRRSLEQSILRAAQAGELNEAWLCEWVRRADEWLESACTARSLAMGAVKDDEDPIPSRFMQETAYVEWRALGILALLRAHMASSPQEAGKLVTEAVRRLRALARTYDRPDLRIADIPELARRNGVRLTRWFLSDMRAVGGSSPEYGAKAGLIPALEDFVQYEAVVLAAAPEAAQEEALRLLGACD